MFGNSGNGNGSKRTFEKIRTLILISLSKGQQTTNQISQNSGVNWKTVESHLVYFVGRGLVKEVFSSEYVRIFELTEDGKRHIAEKMKKVRIGDKKLDVKVHGKVLA